MMLFYVSLTLWVSAASLADESPQLENNLFPCMLSNRTSGYQQFLRKHLAPASLDQNQWQAFVRNISTCSRPIQSFLPFSEKQRVDSVCSPAGGKTYHGNLCISNQEFTFTTVHVDDNCTVTEVLQETKYIILACDELQGYCRPVHFEPNRNDAKPDQRNPDCQNPSSRNHKEFSRLPPGLLTLALLSAALTHFI